VAERNGNKETPVDNKGMVVPKACNTKNKEIAVPTATNADNKETVELFTESKKNPVRPKVDDTLNTETDKETPAKPKTNDNNSKETIEPKAHSDDIKETAGLKADAIHPKKAGKRRLKLKFFPQKMFLSNTQTNKLASEPRDPGSSNIKPQNTKPETPDLVQRRPSDEEPCEANKPKT
jgi:hypothetical protein